MTPQEEIAALKAQVEENVSVEGSAKVLIDGIQSRVQKAVDDALAANPGVDLSALSDLSTELNASSDALAASVAANTPTA